VFRQNSVQRESGYSLEGVACQTSQFASVPAILGSQITDTVHLERNTQLTTACAVLWDLDGTLVDSAEHHWLAWHEALAAAGHTFDRDYLVATFGQRNDLILRNLLGPDAPNAEIERISDEKEARFRALVRKRGLDLLPGAELWLKRLRAAGWRQALATSAPRTNAETMQEVLSLAGYFGAVVAAEDVQRGKPDPQVFLLAAERVAVAPYRCVVVEDAEAGVAGARSAGMRSIGVGAKHAALGATLAVPSLDELPEDTFENLLARIDF
jgi:beta-phosphoglucomutase